VLVLLFGIASAAEESKPQEPQEPAERIPLQTTMPQYPEDAFRERLEGEVQVCYHIDRRGRPYRIAVRRSTHRLFERPAIEAVRSSTWVPLSAGQELPAIKSCRRFSFRLTPVQEP
jgi:TonB family protein